MGTLEEITLFTSNLSKTVRFYEALADMKSKLIPSEKAEFIMGDLHLLIHMAYPSSQDSNYPPPQDHFAFIVKNVDEVLAKLRNRDIYATFGPRNYDWGRSSYLRDPDGRLVELYQRSDK
jgi:catechol 2,3-dioxygenase-like lactoylglutathione lyase family enzyme